ncbi:MAG: aminoglycoside/choline kinase family phosphotransferase [Rhodoferax sp.]|jgi:aminoglycoside/choline kinase family phosphotransferase
MSQAHIPEFSSFTAPVWSDVQREAYFKAWLTRLAPDHGLQAQTLRTASVDASFRRYFRIDSPQGSRIIMDAPPDQEDCRPFVKVAQLMQAAHLQVPEVLAWDQKHGFMLLSDLGTQTLMQVIKPDDAYANQGLYLQAVDALIAWQLASTPDTLPRYDASLLRRELELFPDWYLVQHRGVVLDADMRRILDEAFAQIIAHNLNAPSVYVHRDFMPRNLMAPTQAVTQPDKGAVAPVSPLGVLDFQDAVYGPITYDIASLMRDAFLSWDEDFCLDITIRYWDKARKAGLPVGEDFGEFYKGVEWMGLQRHLKIAGIFARLTLRDGKPRYLADTPRFIQYIRATCGRYRELKPLLRLIERVEGIEQAEGYAFGRV